MQLGNPVSGFLDRVRPFLKDDKGARMIGAGTNKPYGEKDETLVAELEKQRAKRPDDMALAARWLIALHNARGAEAALTEIDKLLALYPESRELRSVRIDIVDEDDLGYSTAWRKAVDDMASFRKHVPRDERAADRPRLSAGARRRVQERRQPAPQVVGPPRLQPRHPHGVGRRDGLRRRASRGAGGL